MRSRVWYSRVTAVVAAISAISFHTVAGADLCCARTAVFPPVRLPPEQEASPFIESSVYGTLREQSTGCDGSAIQYEELDWGARQDLEALVNAILKVEGVPPDPDAAQQFKELLDNDYVWRVDLKLSQIDKVYPGEWVEGEGGKPYYEPGSVWGDWTIKLALVNVHFTEVAKEVVVSWNGLADGSTSKGSDTGTKENAVKDMVRSQFVPITAVIYEYERIPRSAQLKPEKEVIGSDEEMTIQVQDIHDHQGRPSRSWQRVVIEVKEGKLLNGTRLEDSDRKLYAFEVGTGALQLKYKSPEACETKTENVRIYNSCEWGRHPEPIKMEITAPKQEIGSAEFEIVCAEGTVEFHNKGCAPFPECTVEEISDLVSFHLQPTKDPCVYNIEGSESPIHHRMMTWKHRHGSPPCVSHWTEWWHWDRQTRITGGVVSFRDADRRPFRPVLEHRDFNGQAETLIIDCYGKERRSHHRPIFGTEHCVGSRCVEGWFQEMTGEDGDGMELRNGTQLFPGMVGINYILHIEEQPFQRLEERCRKYMESHGTQAPEGGSGSEGDPPSEMPAGPTPLDVKQHEAAASTAPQEQSPPNGGSEVRVLHQGGASLSSPDSGSEDRPRSNPPANTGLGRAHSHDKPGVLQASELPANAATSGKFPSESFRGHSPTLLTTLQRLNQLLPADIPEGWFAPQSDYESPGFAGRLWFKGNERLSISLFEHTNKANAAFSLSREGGKTFFVQGRPAMEKSEETSIVVGRYMLTLRGNSELIQQILPYLQLGEDPDTNAVAE